MPYHLATSPKNQTGRGWTCRLFEKRAKRFELSTFSLARRRSTTELHPRVSEFDSARTQTRTGDSCIFSAVLYQLSYPGRWSSDCRKARGILSKRSPPVKAHPHGHVEVCWQIVTCTRRRNNGLSKANRLVDFLRVRHLSAKNASVNTRLLRLKALVYS